jgi:hypothetical protein
LPSLFSLRSGWRPYASLNLALGRLLPKGDESADRRLGY